jgi:PAS domain S-box-containing protein
LRKVKTNGNSVREVSQPNLGDLPAPDLAPRSDWSEVSESEHFVQFYETDRFLVDSLSGFIGAGLGVGDACMVIATKTHRQELEERLHAYGVDVAAASARGQYVSLDADETLAKFMVDGSPEPGRFMEVIGGLIRQATGGRRGVRAFGEMVALLWSAGNHEAAIHLEELWNNLRKSHSFSLFCAYPINDFVGVGLSHQLDQVCDEHSSVIPAESYTALADPDERLRAITGLQQKAKSLQAKIAEAKEAQKQLEISEIRYRHLFESSTDGILIVDPDTHKITEANPSMAALMETRQEDLLGKELWEIGLLKNREADLNLWQELQENQFVRYEHLSLENQGQQQRDVEFVSNLYRTNGLQVMQCNIRDITERRGAEEVRLHLAAIVESSDDAIISKSLEGVILSWNEGAERIFGYSAEEILGKPVVMLIPPDRRDEEPKILERLKRGERIDHYETVRVSKDGKALDISLTVSPIKDKNGKIIAASKVARDITERKQAEERLREQTEVIETINRTGQRLSAELNLQKVVQVVTNATTELTGARFGAFFYNVIDESGESYMLFALSGVPLEAFAHFSSLRNTDLLGPTFRSAGTMRIADVTKDQGYGKNSPYYGMPPGHLPVTSYLAVPVISRSGEVLGGLFFGHPKEGVFLERHERLVEGLAAQAAIALDNAQLYEMSQQERAKAEEANRMKDEFLATVSHELRTPLNAIIGWSDLLHKGRLDEAGMMRAVETIERNARSQAQLIEDILDVSRVITGKLRLNIEPVDVASAINAAIDSVQLAADSKDIQLGVMLDPSVRYILGDANRLQQIVWNLLSNAIKFTPAGGGVEVRLEPAGANAQIVVSDTGQGISKDFLPFIFERFRQADGTTTRRHGGLGLGLAIVRHLVELHGGTIHAHSEGKGCGATFIITLPLAIAGGRSNKQKRETESSFRREDRDIKPLPSLAGVQVLLVDDDRDSLQILTIMLTTCGAQVQTAASAAGALEVLESYKPDVVVSDLAMPDEDGYSLIGKIRALEAHSGRQTPVVALSAYVRMEDRARALSSGFNLFMSKPVEPNELIPAIASLIESMNSQILARPKG